MERRALQAIAAALVAVAVVLWAVLLRRSDPVPERREIDLVLVIDTTASMGIVLDAARDTFYDVAAHVVAQDATTDLRFGLVAYRDVDDEYITKDLPLTGDLDRVYAELRGYSAIGGGDVPENVDAALDDLVHAMQWRPGATKLAILIGDAPPASRGDVPRFDTSVRKAAEQHILIDALWYGADRDTEAAWRAIASPTGGEVLQLDFHATPAAFRAVIETMLDHGLSKR